MTVDPTRKEWEDAHDALASAMSIRATPRALLKAILGPYPPEPEPTGWRSGDGGIGTLLVTTHADGGVWVGWPHVKHAQLTPDEADAMSDALRKHAAYAREQGDTKPVCGRLPWAHCQLPKGHDGACKAAGA